jgi:copper chaperone NosL
MRGWVCAMLVAWGCSRGPPGPAAITPGQEACASCRMLVSDLRTAGQLVAPGEEPLVFDDLGCLQAYLRTHRPPTGARVYVADHRTRAWVPAGQALFTRVRTLRTPMDSHLVAHADEASRAADEEARGGEPLTAQAFLNGQTAEGPR